MQLRFLLVNNPFAFSTRHVIVNFLEITLEIQLELSYFFFPAFKTRSTLEPPPLAISRELLVLGTQRVISVYLQNWIFPYLENVLHFLLFKYWFFKSMSPVSNNRVKIIKGSFLNKQEGKFQRKLKLSIMSPLYPQKSIKKHKLMWHQ